MPFGLLKASQVGGEPWDAAVLHEPCASHTCALCAPDTHARPSSFEKYKITKQRHSGTTSSTSDTKWPFWASERLWAAPLVQIDAEEEARPDWNLGLIQRKS